MNNGGGAGNRTRVRNVSGVKSFTSLDSFSKLTKIPTIFPVSYVDSETHLLAGIHSGLVYFGGTNHLSII